MTRARRAFALCAVSAALLSSAARGAVEPVLVASGLSAPLRVTAPAGDFGRLFVVEQGGRVRIVKDGVVQPGSFLDLSSRISSGGERGLLGLAFHPDYRRNGRFYVSYTDLSGSSVVSEFRVSAASPDAASPSSERVLLRQAQPYANHNGGNLAFSPLDGTLYVGFGDGGSGGDPQNLAQNDGTFLGKMLRIDVDGRDAGKEYAVPPDNPWAGRASPLPETWAKGLRNPWRFSFDRATGDLWIGDVGQGSWEEIDWQPASSPGGENYGWRRMEGAHCYNPATGCLVPGLTLPVLEYAHASSPSRCSVTGGVVSRGASVPEIAGRYLYADWCSGELFSARLLGGAATDPRNHRSEWVPAGGRSIGAVTDVGEDARGDVYVTDGADGEVFRLRTTTPSATRMVVPIVLDAAGRNGARFQTELVAANRGAATATLRATYVPAPSLGGAGGGTVAELLGRGEQKVFPDALAWLRSHGLAIPAEGPQGGTLRVELLGLASASDGAVLARTTTPSGPGRAGLAYPAPRAQDLAAESAVLYGLRENASDRTNLALLSGAASGTTVLRVTLFSEGRAFVLPEDVSLAPGEWVQLGSVLAAAGFPSGWAVVERVRGPGPFWAYAVFNDNATNDGSYVAPSPRVLPSGTVVVPAVVETPSFESELVLANPGDAPVAARLLWVETLATGKPRRFESVEPLAPGAQLILPSFVDRLRRKLLPVGARGGSWAGALFVSFETAGGRPARGYAGARTAAPAEGGGAYGLFTPGAHLAACAWDEAWLFGLRQDAAVRTNLALVNAGADGGDLVLRYEAFDSDTGRKVGASRDLALGPGAWLQVDRVLSPFALREGYVRVTRVSGVERFLAYAVVNDGAVPGGPGTHDGSFVAMEGAE